MTLLTDRAITSGEIALEVTPIDLLRAMAEILIAGLRVSVRPVATPN